jgi:hypothetical protein
MDAALEDGEDRLDLIRSAIEKEITRREKAKRRPLVASARALRPDIL